MTRAGKPGNIGASIRDRLLNKARVDKLDPRRKAPRTTGTGRVVRSHTGRCVSIFPAVLTDYPGSRELLCKTQGYRRAPHRRDKLVHTRNVCVPSRYGLPAHRAELGCERNGRLDRARSEFRTSSRRDAQVVRKDFLEQFGVNAGMPAPCGKAEVKSLFKSEYAGLNGRPLVSSHCIGVAYPIGVRSKRATFRTADTDDVNASRPCARDICFTRVSIIDAYETRNDASSCHNLVDHREKLRREPIQEAGPSLGAGLAESRDRARARRAWDRPRCCR